MKQIYLLCCLALPGLIQAQSHSLWALGLQGGIGQVGVYGPAAANTLSTDMPQLGMHLRGYLLPYLSLQVEANLERRGYKSPTRWSNRYTLIEQRYLSLPLSVRFEWGAKKSIRPYLGLGGYFAKKLGRAQLKEVLTEDNLFIRNPNPIGTYDCDWGIQALAGVRARLNRHFSLFSEVQSQFSLRHTGEGTVIPIPSELKYYAVSMRFGLSWQFGKRANQS